MLTPGGRKHATRRPYPLRREGGQIVIGAAAGINPAARFD
jgi:hypothetical protein